MTQDYFAISGPAVRPGAGGVRESLFRLSGEFDLAARDELRDSLVAAVDRDRPGRIVVDLAEVTFMDSEALGALIDGYLAAQAAGTAFQLVNASSMIRRVLQIMDLQCLHPDASGERHHPVPGS